MSMQGDEPFTAVQLAQIKLAVSEAVKEEFSDAGLRVDDARSQDEAREDFRFIRRFRRGVDGFASKIGWAIIAAIVGGAIYIVNLGLNVWRGGGGG